MKIKNPILIMLGSLLLPLAGAFAHVAPQADVTNLQSGEVANLPGLTTADEQAMEPLRKKKKSKKSKKSLKNFTSRC